jgi:acyl-coenzyme A synthetase/AMP-(fatty) acid ligase
MRDGDADLPEHTRAMAAALARAAQRDGWLETPELTEDYRGPRDVPYTRFGDPGRDTPTLESLARIVAAMPESPACEDADRALDFRALHDAVGRLAAAIRASGTEGPVGLLLSNTVGYPVAVLACLAAGRIALLLDAAAPPAWNGAILRHVGAGLLVAATAADGAPFGWPCIGVDAALAPGEAPFPPRACWLSHDAPAFIICTSGSTGQPKALVHSQRTVMHQVARLIDEFHLSPRDRFLIATSAATTAGLFTLLSILSGSALHLVALDKGGIQALRQALHSRPVTVLRAGPSLMRIIARLPDAQRMLAGVRMLRSTGEPLLVADVAAIRPALPPGCMINNGYGATEIAGTCWFVHPGDAQDPVRVAAGILNPGTEAKIVDEDGRPCPPGEVGELWMRTRYAALGEWQDGRVVPGRIEPDPIDPSLRVFRTGDLARLTPDGAIVVLGRKDRMLKVNGMRVELAEVEAALRRSPEVAQAAVVARQSGGRVLLAGFVVPADTAQPGIETRLREALVQHLPAHMRPARIVAIGTMPLLPGGKRDEGALLRMLDAV